MNSQKVADGVFLSEIGFYEFAKPGLATLALVGPDSLDGGRIPAGRTLVTRGLLRANEGLFLASKQIDFLAELIHQKIQFCHSFGVQHSLSAFGNVAGSGIFIEIDFGCRAVRFDNAVKPYPRSVE